MDPDPTIATLAARILAWFREGSSQPCTRSELARHLAVPPDDRAALRLAIQALENEGELRRFKKARYGLPTPAPAATGRLSGRIEFPSPQTNRNAWITLDPAATRAHRQGFHGQQVFVPARLTGTALPGDHVAFELVERDFKRPLRRSSRRTPAGHTRERRWEARVTQILHRRRTQFTALLKVARGFAHAIPDEAAFPRPFELDPASLPPAARDESQVVIELVAWPSPLKPPLGRICKVLGQLGAPGVDILRIIHQYDLPQDFPPAVLAEATLVPAAVTPAEIASREDWRMRAVYTIDPLTARDFDDAICITPLAGGAFELGVFIADVAHYVRAGSALDAEARRRGNSVYLVDRVIPMLPPSLSNGICSLNPDVDRLAHAVVLQFDAQGKRTAVRFAKTVIRSERRFTYDEAFTLLQAPAQPADPRDARFQQHLREAWALASLLRRRRMEHGSLDLEFPEVEVLLGPDGVPSELRLVVYDESHQLIEEFMLAANEAVAEHVKNHRAGSIYRIHEDPDPAKLLEFRDLARAYGHRAGDLTHRQELQKLIADIKQSPAERALSLALLKSLKRAAYSADPLGHFGLAKVNYTHFTSPIRRYSDLVVHRILEKLTTAPSNSDRFPRRAELEEIAGHLSDTERIAAEAERDSKMLKQFEYLLNLSRSEQRSRFQAVVLEIAPRGIFVEIQSYYLRGLIRKQDLPRGAYLLDARSQRVLDERGHLLYTPGSALEVELLRVDMENRFLDFIPARSPAGGRPPRRP